MFRRFETVLGCGIFEDYRWDSGTPDFERINLVYGGNGAGKTSIARALEGLSSGGSGYANVSIAMNDQDKTSNSRSSDQQPDPEFDRVFVFSDGYIAENHDFSAEAEVEAVLTLGKRTVDDEKRLTELRGLEDGLKEKLENARRNERDAAKALEDAYTNFSRGVVTNLSRAGGSYKSNANYNTAVAKRKFDGSHAGWNELVEADKVADLATINSDERQKVPSTTHSFVVRQGLHQDVLDALGEAPVAVVLDTLQGHPEATSWVEEGRHLHDKSTQCLYCGGVLSAERKRQIEQHFSDEVERVQRSVDLLLQEVKEAETDLQGLLGDGTIAGSLYADLRGAFNAAHEAASEQLADLVAWLSRVRTTLEEKRSNVVKQVSPIVDRPPSVDGATMDEVLATHNDRVAKHAELVQQAARRVELHLLKEAEGHIRILTETADQTHVARLAEDEALSACQQQIAALENVEGDPLPSAETMSRELARILGRSELTFTLLPDGRHYRVTRHGAPARDLSTGERTAVTLIHFLEHVRQADAYSGRAIVVIDDPISSLDSGAAMGISTYIWSETVSKTHVEQVFLLTHNFELFRQWDIQIEGLPGARGPKNSKGFPSNCYELVAPHRYLGGNYKRVPAFVAWPPNEETRKKVRSAYHHGFIRSAQAYRELLANDTMEHRLDAMLLYPNVLRRVLETFLAFKSPTSVGSFAESMRVMGQKLEGRGYPGDADALRLQLTRFTHASSHAESPETNAAATPDEVGAIFGAAFAFIHAIDAEHFEGLCEVVGVQPGDLLVLEHPDHRQG